MLKAALIAVALYNKCIQLFFLPIKSDAVVKQCAGIPEGLTLAENLAAFLYVFFFLLCPTLEALKNQCKATTENWALVH